tara:strand:- start:3433 stop:3975 length:543 start_codon:yes stop_codon:yes gene_type:complete
MGDRPHKLFVSNRCQHCNSIIQKLNEASLIKKFNIINIDMTPPPPFLQRVPTILTGNREKIEGKSAFEWISNQQKKDNGNELESISTGYGKGGFDNMSESYSLIDDTGKHLQGFLQNSFSFISDKNDDVQNSMHAPPGHMAGIDNGQARRTGQADKDDRLEQLKQQRDNDNFIAKPVHRV